jgi:hypothetical protein
VSAGFPLKFFFFPFCLLFVFPQSFPITELKTTITTTLPSNTTFRSRTLLSQHNSTQMASSNPSHNDRKEFTAANMKADRFIPAGYSIEQQRAEEEAYQNRTIMDRVRGGGLVSLGAAGTAGILGYGVYTFSKGTPGQSARFLGYRVMFQGATVACLLGYGIWAAYRGSNSRDHK